MFCHLLILNIRSQGQSVAFSLLFCLLFNEEIDYDVIDQGTCFL